MSSRDSPEPATRNWFISSVGVDVGGAQTKVVEIREGKVVRWEQYETPQDVSNTLPRFVTRLIAPGHREFVPLSIGVVVPGYVDERAGIAIWSANLGWRNIPLGKTLGESLSTKVVVGHDVRAGLVGERHFGAVRGMEDALFLPLGTGVGVAALVNGCVVSGGPPLGEIGHVVVDRSGPRCGCGARGCLEVFVGARGLKLQWAKANGGEASGHSFFEAVANGDPAATAIWETGAQHLGRTLAPVVATLGSKAVVIGGGIAEARNVALDPIRHALTRHLPAGIQVPVRQAGLGDWAGAVGAAVLAAGALS